MKRWRRRSRLAFAASALAIGLFICASNSCLYLSHQRFPFLAHLQLNHRSDSSLRVLKPVVVGHRGIPRTSTNPNATPNSTIGNTRASIKEAALSEHIDWIEIDVRRTADGKLVLFHDARLEEKTDLEGKVESTDWIDLQKAKLWVENEDDQSILLLETVLTDFSSPDLRWILDIKLDSESEHRKQEAEILKRDVVGLLKEMQVPDANVLIFGDREVLEAFHESGCRCGYTALYETHKSLVLSHSEVLQRCEDNACDLLVVPIVFLTPSLVQSAQERGIKVWSYDSNDAWDLQYCLECGVEGLIVDRPVIDVLP